MKMSVKAARDLASALTMAADSAEARGETEFDFLGEAKAALDKAQAELAAALVEGDNNKKTDD